MNTKNQPFPRPPGPHGGGKAGGPGASGKPPGGHAGWPRKTPLGLASCGVGGAACLFGMILVVAAAIGSENKGTTIESITLVVFAVSFLVAFPCAVAAIVLAGIDILRDVKNGKVILRDASGKIDWKNVNWEDLSLSWIGLLLGTLPLCVCGILFVFALVAVAANAPRRRIIIEE
jgi:hypothetical protein